MRVVFAGTPEFAVPSLEQLLQSQHDVVAVLTQPDRPAGRGRQVRPSPVKACAIEAGISVHQPKQLRDVSVQNTLSAMSLDVMVVVAYGLLLPTAVLELPQHGCVNVHPSLLPRWRGAAPIQHTLLAGDEQTGVAIMQLDAGMDTGPILMMEKTDIDPADTSQTLHDRLARLGATLLVKTLDEMRVGAMTPQPQSQSGVTYADKIIKSDAVIDWSQPARVLANQVRAYNPWPVSQTTWRDRGLRIWQAEPTNHQIADHQPGDIVHVSQDGVDVATGDGCLRLLRVQLSGAKQITAAEFANQLNQYPDQQQLGIDNA